MCLGSYINRIAAEIVPAVRADREVCVQNRLQVFPWAHLCHPSLAKPATCRWKQRGAWTWKKRSVHRAATNSGPSSLRLCWSFQPPPPLVLPASTSAGPSSFYKQLASQLLNIGYATDTLGIHYGYATDTLQIRYRYATDTLQINVGKLKQRNILPCLRTEVESTQGISCLVFGLKWSLLKEYPALSSDWSGVY